MTHTDQTSSPKSSLRSVTEPTHVGGGGSPTPQQPIALAALVQCRGRSLLQLWGCFQVWKALLDVMLWQGPPICCSPHPLKGTLHLQGTESVLKEQSSCVKCGGEDCKALCEVLKTGKTITELNLYGMPASLSDAHALSVPLWTRLCS